MSDPNAKIKQRQIIIVGGVVVSILGLMVAGMYMFEPSPPQAKVKPTLVSLTPPGSVDDKDAWRSQESARVKVLEANLAEMKSKVAAQELADKKLGKDFDDLKAGRLPNSSPASTAVSQARAADTLNQPLGMPPKQGQILTSPLSGAQVQGKPGTLNQPLNGQQVAPPPPRDQIEMFTFDSAQGSAGAQAVRTANTPGDPEVLGFPVNERATKMASPVDPRTGDKSGAIEFIPAGSFVRVAMLNGVDAPTGGQAQSNPLPIAFQVLDTANLANKYRLDIKDCRVIAAAWGDLSSERTFGRTETLTCIINGETVEMPLKGTIIGEDGKAGMRGRLVTKQGQLLANTLFAGSLAGIGKAMTASATTTTTGGGGVTQSIDPSEVGRAAIGGGISSSSQMLATYYLKAAEKLFPVIETDGGRVVEILITKGAVYKGSAVKRDQYRGLLRRTNSLARTNDDED